MEEHALLKKVVTIGGGKGQSTILQGLNNYSERIFISAIVSMVDNGGSTGRFSEELGIPPFGGDFKDVMTGLSRHKNMKALFHHRYEHGKDIKGHTVGNLILLGLLEKSDWDIPKAIKLAKSILNIEADIFPSTLDKVHLVAEYEDGQVVTGQDEIDNNTSKEYKKIVKVTTDPIANAYDGAVSAIQESDIIVLTPGDLYGSLLCNIVIPGIHDAILDSDAAIVYISNLMTKGNQTNGWTSSDFIDEVQRYLPRKIDYAIVNTGELDESITGGEQYSSEHWDMVIDDIEGDNYKGVKIIKESIWHEGMEFKRVSTDVIPRSFIRHDSQKIAGIIAGILKV